MLTHRNMPDAKTAACEQVHGSPDVFRVRIPLPGSALREMNSYIVKDGADTLVVDTGFDEPECRSAMAAAFAELGVADADASLFITHGHADHCGLVDTLPWARVCLHPDSYAILSAVASGAWGRRQAATTLEMGFTPEETDLILLESPSSARRVHCLFEPTLVQGGERLRVGRFAFECLHTPGHAPGHTCLYLPESGLLITGDHILFDISPNIAHWVGSEDPLADYLRNLRKMRNLPVTLALPGHREPRGSIAQRIDELLSHHDARLRECAEAVSARAGQNACDIAKRISWARGRQFNDMNPTQRLFAAGEARAHVEHLVRQGKVARELLEGTVRYTAR